MDGVPTKDRDTVIDIESKDVETPVLSDELVEGEISVSISTNPKNIDELSPDLGKNSKRDKRKSTGAKKPPKPPRPPRGLSLDAADQKLITELAMIKRARIERMKALKKMKATKATSMSASSVGNLIAMVFTIIFCVVIIFQGCHSMGTSPRSKLATPIPGSLKLTGVAEGNIPLIRDQGNIAINQHRISQSNATGSGFG